MSTLTGWVSGYLAQSPAPPPSQGPEFGGSSPIGLVVTLILLVAVVFLVRSMNRHLRKLPKSFDEPEQPADTTAAPPGQPTATTEGKPADHQDSPRR